MTILRAAWLGTQRIVQVVTSAGEVVATIYPTKDNAIHISSMEFEDDPICPSEGETGLPGLLVKFKEQ